jgi:hypothetical protein
VTVPLDLGGGYSLKHATWLDIPLIYEQLMEGAEQGVFTDAYLGPKGPSGLFLETVRKVFNFGALFSRKPAPDQWWLVSTDGTEIGCIRLGTTSTPTGDAVLRVDVLAIAKPFRLHGHGTAVLRGLIARQAPSTEIQVVCTKYARGMQKTLKSLHFQRNTKGPRVYALEEYLFTAPA